MSERENQPNMIKKGMAAGLLVGAVVLGGMAYQRHEAGQERPGDRIEAEHDINGNAYQMTKIIEGVMLADGVEQEGISQLVKQNSILDKKDIQAGEETILEDSKFLLIPGGFEYTGPTSSIFDEDSIDDIDWSNIDGNSVSVSENGDFEPIRFEGLKVKTDKFGNSYVVGVSNSSRPADSETVIDIYGAAESGAKFVFGVDSDSPTKVEMPGITEGYAPYSYGPLSSQAWNIESGRFVSSQEQINKELSRRGVSVDGVLAVNRGEVTEGMNDIPDGLPLVDTYLIVQDQGQEKFVNI